MEVLDRFLGCLLGLAVGDAVGTEVTLWCFYHTSSFKESILAAANLGDDADTTAAVCGQVARAYYAQGGIPGSWIDRPAKRDLNYSLAEKIYQHTLGK